MGTISAKTGLRLGAIIEAIDKTLAAHQKRVPTHTLNEVIRDALLFMLPTGGGRGKKRGRVYYATQVGTEPPVIKLFCNDPKLFRVSWTRYFENKLAGSRLVRDAAG